MWSCPIRISAAAGKPTKSYMDKLFIPVQGCLLEVAREQYADFYKDKERWRYLKKLDTNHKLLSLEGFTDSEGNVLDFVVDEAVDVAENCCPCGDGGQDENSHALIVGQ